MYLALIQSLTQAKERVIHLTYQWTFKYKVSFMDFKFITLKERKENVDFGFLVDLWKTHDK